MGASLREPCAPSVSARAHSTNRARRVVESRVDQPGRRRLQVLLGLVGVGLGLFTFAPFVATALDAARQHRVFLGATGPYPMDVLQYLAWIRDAHNGLIRDLYGVAHEPALFLHPMWSPSGWVQALTGVSDAAIVIFWTAVGAAVLFWGCIRLAVRHIPADQPGRRACAVLVALFGGLTPFALHLRGFNMSYFTRAGGDLVPAAALWDYAPLTIALGLMPFAIEGLERLVSGEPGSRRAALGTAALVLLITWLHPWQGETLLAVAAGLMLWRRHELNTNPDKRTGGLPARSRLGVLLIAGAVAVPVFYYLILSRVDVGWAVAEHASVGAARIPLSVVIWCVAPLALIGLVAARRVVDDRSARGLLLWPAATLLIVLLSPSGQYRAIDGLSMPLAVLVVRAWPRGGRRWAVVPALLALSAALVPAILYFSTVFSVSNASYLKPYEELAPSDVQAVQIAARAAGDGPILSAPMLGTAIPALTDQTTWVGHPIWTPDETHRAFTSYRLFGGWLTPLQTRALVDATGTRAIVEPCGSIGRLEPALAPLGFREIAVGCARVYEKG